MPSTRGNEMSNDTLIEVRDKAFVRLKLADGSAFGLSSGSTARLERLRRDDGTPQGSVFVPFAYYEAAANLMTNAALDPFGKIPEFKYCAIAVKAGGDLAVSHGFF